MNKTVHYTTLGLSIQPREADPEGFLHYGEDYKSAEDRTAAENLILEREKEIDGFRLRSGVES